MARDRKELGDILEEILGSNNVYYSPPNGMQLQYPCFIYRPSILGSRYADGKRYIKMNRYLITIIDYDPDSELPDKILELPTAAFETSYCQDDLNHWQITLYF